MDDLMHTKLSEIKMEFDEDFLAHYGVLGMKWGVRKDRRKGSGGSSPRKKSKVFKSVQRAIAKSKKKKAQKKKQQSNTPKKPNVKTMSDEELRRRINRLQMEQQYAALTKSPPSKGKQMVGQIMKTIGTNVTSQASKAAGKVVAEAVEEMMRELLNRKPKEKKA